MRTINCEKGVLVCQCVNGVLGDWRRCVNIIFDWRLDDV